VQCWGNNLYGRLGDGTTTARSTPVPVLAAVGSPLPGVVAIAGGFSHTCGLTAADGLQCWGYNASGQLGDGSGTDRPLPTSVTGLGAGSVQVFGEATVTTSSLPGGTHSITAEYSGSEKHTGATSDPLTQTVTPAEQSLSFTSTAPTNVNVGAAY